MEFMKRDSFNGMWLLFEAFWAANAHCKIKKDKTVTNKLILHYALINVQSFKL